MTFSALSAHAEEFLALKRAVAKADPHGNSQDRRSLKHREKLLRSFVAYWRDQQMSVADPVLFGPGLGCCRIRTASTRTVISVASMSCALSCNRSAHSSPQQRYLRTSIDLCTAVALRICIPKMM